MDNNSDKFLNKTFKLAADYMRDKYLEKEDKEDGTL